MKSGRLAAGAADAVVSNHWAQGGAGAVGGDRLLVDNLAPQGVDECGRALELDRILASAHAFIGFGKIFVGRAEETDYRRGLSLSPSDTNAHTSKSYAGYAKTLLGRL